MKSESARGIIQLIIAILIYYLLDNYTFYVLGLAGLHFEGTSYLVVNLLKYVLICFISYLIYRSSINSSKFRIGKSKLLNVIFSLGTFILLVLLNALTHWLLNALGHPISGYGFINYFSNTLTIDSALNLIIDVILKPFLLVVIFPLGFSNIIKSMNGASILSGIVYGLLYVINLHLSIYDSFFQAIIPAVIMIFLTYLYKCTHNIWIVYISYALYICLGVYIIGYFV